MKHAIVLILFVLFGVSECAHVSCTIDPVDHDCTEYCAKLHDCLISDDLGFELCQQTCEGNEAQSEAVYQCVAYEDCDDFSDCLDRTPVR